MLKIQHFIFYIYIIIHKGIPGGAGGTGLPGGLGGALGGGAVPGVGGTGTGGVPVGGYGPGGVPAGGYGPGFGGMLSLKNIALYIRFRHCIVFSVAAVY